MASAALSCIALLTLILLPVALYLAKRLRPSVGIAETHLSLCAAALPPMLVACYVLGRSPLIRPWLYLVLLALVQSGGVSLAVLVLHRLCLRRVPLVVVPAVPELPTAAELAETSRRSTFAGCAARALLPEIPALPDDEARSQRLQPQAERLRRHRAPLGIAALLTLLLFACAGPVPVKRTLVVRSHGEFALTLVFPGLQAHAAAPLLQADGAATCERLGTVATSTALVSALEEETLPPKDEGAEPRSTTTIVGTLLCEVPR